MARYRLDIMTPNPWTPFWPDLAAFHGARRQRGDAALLMLKRAIWEAMDGLALRDRPIAHDLMSQANKVAAPSPGYFVKVSACGWSFLLYREA